MHPSRLASRAPQGDANKNVMLRCREAASKHGSPAPRIGKGRPHAHAGRPLPDGSRQRGERPTQVLLSGRLVRDLRSRSGPPAHSKRLVPAGVARAALFSGAAAIAAGRRRCLRAGPRATRAGALACLLSCWGQPLVGQALDLSAHPALPHVLMG